MSELQYVPVDKLYPHPQNPRLVQREDVVSSIESQLREKGSFDPAHALLVRALGDGYQIVMGHHRYEAAKRAGLNNVPCWVRELADDEAFMMLATSNTQDSMDPIEWGKHALSYVELAKNRHDNGNGLREYARQLGRDHSYVVRARSAAEVLTHFLSHHYKDESSGAIELMLMGKTYHLDEIHKCPKVLWVALVYKLLSDGWSVAETKERTADLRDLAIPEKWQSFLPIEKAGDKELGQLSRYHDYISGAIYDLSPFDPCDNEKQNWTYFYMLPDIKICKVLVATSFDDLLSYTSPSACSFIKAKKVHDHFKFSTYQQWTGRSRNNELVNTLAPFAHHIANFAHDKRMFSQQIENAKIEKAIRNASACTN